MMRLSLCSSFTTILCCLLWAETTSAFVVHVEHEDEHCFIIRTPNKDSTISGSYDLLDDNLSPDPVSILILNDELHSLYQSPKGSTGGQFSIHAQGRLHLCIQNGLDHAGMDELDRGVSFEVRVSVQDLTAPAVKLTSELVEKLWNLQVHQDHMRSREALHREVAEGTFEELLIWTVAEAVALVVVSGLQVLYFRRFLEKRRFM
jgi:hypothetical protein